MTLFDAVAATRARNNLPALGTRVVGRAEVIDRLHRELRQSRLVSIVGAGGIGKTTVALAVAERALGQFVDGVWMVDFARLHDPSLVPHAIASATGLVVHSADVLGALCRFARGRELLLVLDNCEHMTSAIADCLTRILMEAPAVHVLTTSRAELRVRGEQVHTLRGLSSPADSRGLTAAQALSYPAIELFVERATDRLESFVLRDEDAPTVADLCSSLDGIALAIELAAMRVDTFGVADLRKQLDDRMRLLAGRRAGPERQRTLAATLDWSYGLLSPDEARLLRAVSVFAGAFQLHAAATVADLTPPVTAALLRELASKSLLWMERDDSYRLLETTRTYCLEKLTSEGEDLTVRQRHADALCAVLERAASEWPQQLSRNWAAAYGAHLDDLRALLAWASSDPAQRALQVRLTAAGAPLWNHFSLTDESRVHLARAIARLDEDASGDFAVEMKLQFALAGAILYTQGVVPEARTAMHRALRLSEQLGDTDLRLRCLRLIGTYELFAGEHDRAIQTLQTFLSIASAEDLSALSEGETHLGVGQVFVGRIEEARLRMEQLATIRSQDFNDTRFARFQYSNGVNVSAVLCHAQWLTGRPDAAARTAQEMVDYGHQAAHELSLSIALAWGSLLNLWLGREDVCTQYVAMLDELVERHGIVTWRPIVTFCRGANACSRAPGDAGGISLLTTAVEQFRAFGHMARLPYYMAFLADALGQRGRFDDAEAAIREALTLARAQNERWCLAEVLRVQASLALARGQRERAEALLHEAVASAARVGALSWQLRAAHDLAVLWTESRPLQAKRTLQSVYDAFQEGLETRDLACAARRLALLP